METILTWDDSFFAFLVCFLLELLDLSSLREGFLVLLRYEE